MFYHSTIPSLSDSHSYQFSKKEKLKSRKLIEKLFAEGSTFLVFPIKVVFLIVDEPMDNPIKVGVSASSKKFKNAVDRNRIKRLIKENYRLNKLPLHDYLSETNKQVAVFFMYIDKALPENALLQRKMPILIDKLIKTIGETSNPNI